MMAGQLGQLITVASLPSVSVGIIPMGLDRDAVWPVEDFWIFDDRQVNVELVSGWLTLTQLREIAIGMPHDPTPARSRRRRWHFRGTPARLAIPPETRLGQRTDGLPGLAEQGQREPVGFARWGMTVGRGNYAGMAVL